MRQRPSADGAAARLLLIDAGHSRIKFHLYQRGALPLRTVLPLRPLEWPAQEDFSRFDECLLMGTNERLHVRLSSHLRQANWPAPMVLGRDIAIPVQTLAGGVGNDRLANALGAGQEFKNESLLLVSAGSALVIDVMDRAGTLQGGLIGMGLGCYREAMLGISDKLVWNGTDEGSYPARETSTAVFQGWLQPALASIELLQKKHGLAKLVLTGGDAGRLAEHLPHAQVRPNLGADAMAQALAYA